MECSLNDINCKPTSIWRSFNYKQKSHTNEDFGQNIDNTKSISVFPITYLTDDLVTWSSPGSID